MKKLLLLTAFAAVGSLATSHAGITVVSAPGFNLTWDGNDGDFFNATAPPVGALVPNNPALASNGGVAFASADPSLHFPPHAVANLNDGFYGNANSHINGQGPSPGDMGVILSDAYFISSFAFGRDNGNGQFDDSVPGTDCCGGNLDDRYAGVYTIQLTSDGGANWTTVGYITLDGSGNDIAPGGLPTPWLRHEFEVSSEGPIIANGIRINTPNTGVAIDEIEVYGTLVPEPSGTALLGLGLLGLLLRRKR
jgi:hypothetical protein